jgi:hypothetical protein
MDEGSVCTMGVKRARVKMPLLFGSEALGEKRYPLSLNHAGFPTITMFDIFHKKRRK